MTVTLVVRKKLKTNKFKFFKKILNETCEGRNTVQLIVIIMAPPPTPGQGSSPAPAATSTPSTSQAPPTDTKFLEGEKILCFHGPLIYEAKIQKVELKDNQTKYFIHYMGWNKNWDEWVKKCFLSKFNTKQLCMNQNKL